MADLSYVPLYAVPQDVLGVDGANKELEHKLPVAHTEQDVDGGAKDSDCFSHLVAICENECDLDSVC